MKTFIVTTAYTTYMKYEVQAESSDDAFKIMLGYTGDDERVKEVEEVIGEEEIPFGRITEK